MEIKGDKDRLIETDFPRQTFLSNIIQMLAFDGDFLGVHWVHLTKLNP